MSRPILYTGALAVSAAVLLAACSSSGRGTSETPGSSPGSSSTQLDSAKIPEFTGTGTVPSGEPNINGDGKVVIGIMSPGDTNDHGYYQSFVDAADKVAKSAGWKTIVVDRIPAANAVQQAENLCRQGADMVAIGASELADGLQAAAEPVCAKSFFYINGGPNVVQTPQFTQSLGNPAKTGYAAGVASGLYMKTKQISAAGFIAGVQAAYNTDFYKAWAGGIKSVLPKATTLISYTGDPNDSAKGVEAFKAQQAQQIGLVYPYLGGSTLAVAKQANASKIAVVTPTTDECALASPRFDISVIASPGDYFSAILQQFKAGTLPKGVTRNWRIGVDPVPTVKFCHPVGAQAQDLGAALKSISEGTVGGAGR